MNKKLTMIAAGIGLALSVPTVAAAAPWVPVGQRVANLNVRIDQGVRNGSLTGRRRCGCAPSCAICRGSRRVIAAAG